MRLVFLMLFSQTLLASDVVSEFEKFYYSNEISSRHCGRNVSNFIDHLESKNIDTSEIDVIHLTAESSAWGFGKIIALNSRWGKSMSGHSFQAWYFHVIAVYKDKVLDFSFGKEPTTPSMEAYLEEMYVASEPILLYGSGFSIRGEGPYYTPEISRETLDDLKFEDITE